MARDGEGGVGEDLGAGLGDKGNEGVGGGDGGVEAGCHLERGAGEARVRAVEREADVEKGGADDDPAR